MKKALIALAVVVVAFIAMATLLVTEAEGATRAGAQAHLVHSNFDGWCGRGFFTVCVSSKSHAECYKGLGGGWWRCTGTFVETGARRHICNWEGSTNGSSVIRIRGAYPNRCWT